MNPVTEGAEARHLMKIAEQRKVVRNLDEEKARKEGREEGLKEGREERNVEIAGALKRKGVDIDIIVSSTGLSKPEIEKL